MTEMSSKHDEYRDVAVERGVEFLYRMACDPKSFEEYGFDMLSAFYGIFSTTKNPSLRARAQTICLELARTWRSTHPQLPAEIDADTLTEFVIAADAADRMELSDAKMKTAIRSAAKQFRPEDYYWFDPRSEPPPRDVPQDCDCGAENPRRSVSCRDCQQPLAMMSRYEVWLLAIIRTYFGESYGVSLGARYADALRWLPHMHPYAGPDADYEDFYWSIYAVTHVVYTLNDYGLYSLSPAWLPEEYEFLKASLPAVIADEDCETLGEILDALKAFGLTSNDQSIALAEQYVISSQNSDGSWGDVETDDIYERYHPTLTAIDGLREHTWHSTESRSQYVVSLLDQTRNLLSDSPPQASDSTLP